MSTYNDMNTPQAAAALEEFLQERRPALDRLADALAADGQDPEQLLDGSLESLTPLWRWAKSRLAAKTDAGRHQPQQLDLPSWLRHTMGREPVLSRDSLQIVDGVTSYFCYVVEAGAPQAQWRVGHDAVKSYIWQNHPVLACGPDEYPVVNRVAALARSHLLSTRSNDPASAPSADDDLTAAATSLIQALTGRPPSRVEVEGGEEEPLVKVEELESDDYDFEVYLREDIAHEQSELVDELTATLGGQPGVAEAFREDRERLLLRAPDWTVDRLETWSTSFLRRRVQA